MLVNKGGDTGQIQPPPGQRLVAYFSLPGHGQARPGQGTILEHLHRRTTVDSLSDRQTRQGQFVYIYSFI